MGAITVRQLIRVLEQDGWVMVRCRGDHRQFRREGSRYVITIAGHSHDDVPAGTLRNIERLSGLCLH